MVKDGQTDCNFVAMSYFNMFVCVVIRVLFVFILVVRLFRTVLFSDIGIV